MKRLIFVTGTRADFGKLEPLATAAKSEGFEVCFFVTGMHMMRRFGMTKLEVSRSGLFDVTEFVNQRIGDDQDVVLAKTVLGFSDCVKEHQPDLVIVHGDRVEALAAALVCSMNYIRCAHIEGGEVSGTIDEVFRHCNTKLAHAHLVSSGVAKARVMRLGESQSSIHILGSPELDFHARPSGVPLSEVLNRYEIEESDYGIVILHPVTSESSTMDVQASLFFDALKASGKYFVVILPNNDPGSEAILARVNELPTDKFRVLPSMRFAYFSELLKNASAILGNSSTGVREAPFLGVPSLDFGTRQRNRSFASSIKRADLSSVENIESFIRDEWGKRYVENNDFGSGDATERFINILNDPDFWSTSLQKYFSDEL